ncbi:MAG TPA: GNAT family N-acetyltransferase [Chlamydiales bacterium]|nr:GNAT family N-acetyltransferase [Chlamydiales bacterium]
MLLICFNLFSVHYEWEGSSEIQSLHDLFLSSFLQNYQKLGLTEADLATDDIEKVLNAYWNEELACINNNSIRWIVAKDQDEIVGYASFDTNHSPDEVFVQLICVKPEYQGQGIGKNLLYSIFQVEDKIHKLSLVTRRVNRSAIAFYKRLGFEENVFLDKKTNVDKSLCVQLEKFF